MKIPYPLEIREIASSAFGCDIGSHATIPRSSFFGLEMKARATTKRTPAVAPTLPSAGVQIPVSKMPVTRTAYTPEQTLIQPTPAKAIVPKTITPPVVFTYTGTPDDKAKAIAALAAADRVLSDPKVSNGKQVVETTLAIAREPIKSEDTLIANKQKEIVQGAAVLQAVQQMREDMNIPPGQPMIPVQSPAQAAAVNAQAAESAYVLSDEDIAALFPEEKKNWWARFVDWLASL